MYNLQSSSYRFLLMDTLNVMLKDDALQRIAIAMAEAGSVRPQVVILADDLTGAGDSAASFLGQGRRAAVWLSGSGFSLGAEVWSFSTETRNDPPAVAADCIGTFTERLRALLPAAIFFKKIDSAGRGNFAEEMRAVHEAMGAELTICAPAFPEAGRCVVNGSLEIRDAAGGSAKVELFDLFSAEMVDEVELIGCGTDRYVERAMLTAVEEGKRLLLCDAGSSADLERIVRVASGLPVRVLWAGSAGLARELGRSLDGGDAGGVMRGMSKSVEDERSIRKGGRSLIFCGTGHPLTQLQLEQLSEAESEAVGGSVVAHVRCGVSNDGELRGMFEDAGPVSSLILTGGETAAMVLRALGAEAIEIAGEVAMGVPWGVLHGGLASGCVVVTKSGGFGDRHALVDAVHFCQGVSS